MRIIFKANGYKYIGYQTKRFAVSRFVHKVIRRKFISDPYYDIETRDIDKVIFYRSSQYGN